MYLASPEEPCVLTCELHMQHMVNRSFLGMVIGHMIRNDRIVRCIRKSVSIISLAVAAVSILMALAGTPVGVLRPANSSTGSPKLTPAWSSRQAKDSQVPWNLHQNCTSMVSLTSGNATVHSDHFEQMHRIVNNISNMSEAATCKVTARSTRTTDSDTVVSCGDNATSFNQPGNRCDGQLWVLSCRRERLRPGFCDSISTMSQLFHLIVECKSDMDVIVLYQKWQFGNLANDVSLTEVSEKTEVVSWTPISSKDAAWIIGDSEWKVFENVTKGRDETKSSCKSRKAVVRIDLRRAGGSTQRGIPQDCICHIAERCPLVILSPTWQSVRRVRWI
ncbi:uncharacterized protein LOC125944017 [Dermacentor silvarum]|uniref:uncharacterized protein LOC125944017 n=1 Tax=Dermacentor silvarum TaxID=543639 RepID=UPI002100B8F0|nr:uncharacterized protein LOC125944017 [Dermacentor silvarum]